MKSFKKLIDNVLSKSQMNEFPTELTPAHIFTWDSDLDSNKDWDDWVDGQLVNHTTWDGNHYKAFLDINSLTYGAQPQSFWGMLKYNEQITIFTSKYIPLEGKMVSIGENIKDKYFAMSFELTGLEIGEDKKKKTFFGKIILVNIQRVLDQQFNDSNEAPIINIENGRMGETIEVPRFKRKNKREPHDPDVKNIETGYITNKAPVYIEIHFPKPAILVGGIDFVSNYDRDGKALASTNRLIEPEKVSTLDVKTVPIQPYTCILPTQFNIPSIDNYGWSHPADKSGEVKSLAATQAFASAASTGMAAGGSSVLGNVGNMIGTAGIGLVQKFFGDKGTLANATAPTSHFLSSEADPIKFFIQGDGTKSNGELKENGYMNMYDLQKEYDYLEVNQHNGQFGKYGKPMSPLQNDDFNTTKKFRGLGLSSMALKNKPIYPIDNMPVLKTPFVNRLYPKLKIDETAINDYMKMGCPRANVNNTDNSLNPMLMPETWDVYIRNMFFRPDPFSFWNWPTIMPAEVGVFDVWKLTNIRYDVSAYVGQMFEWLGAINEDNAAVKLQHSMWNKTIQVNRITNNQFNDANKTYSSYRFKFKENATANIHQIQFLAITSSTIKVNSLDKNNKIIRSNIFNSQGIVSGTSADWGNVLQL